MFGQVIICILLFFGLALTQQCGKPRITPVTGSNDDRVVGGREAIPNSWPWQVSLQKATNHSCGGSLINDQWIITAAHCLYRVEALNIKLGKHDVTKTDEGEISIPSAEEGIFIHPNYNERTIEHDIALIKLAHPVTFTSTIQPVCLPGETLTVSDGQNVYVTGWGQTETQPPEWRDAKFRSSVLKQAMVPTVNFDACDKMTPRFVPPNSICTGYPTGGHNPCYGDSGGPLVLQSGSSWYLVGVVSWGPRQCAIEKEPAVFVKVASYIPWIIETIS